MKARKILSLILAVAMIFGTMTTAVFADSTEVVTVTGGEKYATIAEALAKNTEHVILLDDVTESAVVDRTSSLSFYLDGHAMNGTLKIVNAGAVSLNGNLNNGTTIPGASGSKIVSTGAQDEYALWQASGANINVGGVTFEATNADGTAIYCESGKVLFETSDDTTVIGDIKAVNTGIVNIAKGYYTGNLIEEDGGYIGVTGGTFEIDPSNNVLPGYEAVQDSASGLYTVVIKENFTLADLGTDASGNHIIDTPMDVKVFRTLLNTSDGKNILVGENFILTSDIDMNGEVLPAAGSDSKRFMGSFDGQNHTISNVVIDAGEESYVAFFGNISGATIRNLTIDNLSVKGGEYTAGLVGFTRKSVIDNCSVTGDIIIDGGSHVGAIHAGGVVDITRCTVAGNEGSVISGKMDVAGISGLISEGSVTVSGNSVSGVNIVASSGMAGGLIGRAIVGTAGLDVMANTIDNCVIENEATGYDGLTGIVVGCTQAISGEAFYAENIASNTTATEKGTEIKTLYVTKNYDGADYGSNIAVGVAKLGGEYFTTLGDAIEAAEAAFAAEPNPVITLVNDAVVTGGYYNNVGNSGAIDSLTIDLNGYALHLNSDIKVFTDLKVINGSITADFGGTGGFYMFAKDGKTYDAAFENVDINLSNANGFAFLSPNGGDPDATFTFNNCDVTTTGFGEGVSFVNAQGGIKVVVNNTTIKADDCGRVFVNADVDMDNSTIIATNMKAHAFRNLSGTITNSVIDVNGSENGIKNDNGKALVVNGNSKITLTGATSYDINLDKGSTISAEDDAVVSADKANIIGGASVSGNVINKANTVFVQFKKIDKNGNIDTLEGADKYEVILAGYNNDKINELASADLTFDFQPNAITGGALTYVVEPAKGVSLVQTGDRVMFNYNGVDKYEDTGAALVIGTITIEGFGSYALGVDTTVGTNAVYATEIRDSIVEEFDPAATLKLNDDMDTTDDLYGKIEGAVIEIPVRDLEVQIDFNNAANKNSVDYQDMTVVVSGSDIEDIEIKLGDTDVTYDLDIFGKSKAQYKIDTNADNKYVVTVANALTSEGTYTVTVKGAGYRTVRKNVTMNEDATVDNIVKFWNNVKDADGADYLAGDIVKDNTINVYDLSAVVSYFGRTNSTTEVSKYAKYDLNRDGKIDSKDVAYVLVSWGK